MILQIKWTICDGFLRPDFLKIWLDTETHHVNFYFYVSSILGFEKSRKKSAVFWFWNRQSDNDLVLVLLGAAGPTKCLHTFEVWINLNFDVLYCYSPWFRVSRNRTFWDYQKGGEEKWKRESNNGGKTDEAAVILGRDRFVFLFFWVQNFVIEAHCFSGSEKSFSCCSFSLWRFVVVLCESLFLDWGPALGLLTVILTITVWEDKGRKNFTIFSV